MTGVVPLPRIAFTTRPPNPRAPVADRIHGARESL
jgi:hypothetical protein